MNQINFFKLQAKNLHRDFKTRHKVYDEAIKADLYEFTPRFFDVDNIVVTYDISDEEIECFTLMKAQHFISQLVGFKKWNVLIKASSTELELAKQLFDNQHKLSLDDWNDYIFNAEEVNNTSFSPEDRLEIFKNIFLKEGDFATMPNDFRLQRHIERLSPVTKNFAVKKEGEVIEKLPLSEENRKTFINAANSVFENVLLRIGTDNPNSIRKLWNAEEYIDNELLDQTMLPISKDYALSLIDSFLVHHVIALSSHAESE